MQRLFRIAGIFFWSTLGLISDPHHLMNVHVHISLVVKRSFIALQIPKTALIKLVYLPSTV